MVYVQWYKYVVNSKVIVGALEYVFYSQTGVRELSRMPHHLSRDSAN
jgi:hypothetical protein